MPVDTRAATTPKAMLWTGRILSALIVAFLLFGGAMSIAKPDAKKMAELGYPDSLALALGITMIACAILYAIPQTAVLGAILLTGYLGGATATHVRIGEPFYLPIIFGMLVWLGLFLRDARLRALLPLRR